MMSALLNLILQARKNKKINRNLYEIVEKEKS